MAQTPPRLRAVNGPDSAKSRGRRTYSEPFKRAAVEKARASSSVAQVARSLSISRATLRAWMDAMPAAPGSLLEAVRSGDRREYLTRARDDLAAAIDAGMPSRDFLQSLRVLDTYMRELDELDEREHMEESFDDAPDEPWNEEF